MTQATLFYSDTCELSKRVKSYVDTLGLKNMSFVNVSNSSNESIKLLKVPCLVLDQNNILTTVCCNRAPSDEELNMLTKELNND
jgi:hypothetical protein